MQVGDALWQLYGVALLKGRAGDAACCVFMTGCLDVISKFVGVPAPNNEQLEQISSALEKLPGFGPPATGYASESHSKPKPKTNSAYSDPELVAAATKLVEEMTESGQFEWAGLVSSVKEQLEKEDAFITPKQCRALKNIAAGRKYGDDEGTFWDWFCDEWNEHSKTLDKSAGAA